MNNILHFVAFDGTLNIVIPEFDMFRYTIVPSGSDITCENDIYVIKKFKDMDDAFDYAESLNDEI